MGTISATVDTATDALATLSVLPGREDDTKRTYSLLVLLIVVYSSLLVALLILRLRRARESLAYLRYVDRFTKLALSGKSSFANNLGSTQTNGCMRDSKNCIASACMQNMIEW
jgi:hypothetical protein